MNNHKKAIIASVYIFNASDRDEKPSKFIPKYHHTNDKNIMGKHYKKPKKI